MVRLPVRGVPSVIRRFRIPRRTAALRRRGPRAAPRRKRPRGVSLVELLVAVLVMGVGVLGVVGLLAITMQGNRSALLGTEAALLAEDMIDRARANAGSSNAAALYGGLGLGDPPPAPPDCVAVECTPEQMAEYDQAVWKCRMGRFAETPSCIELADAAAMDISGVTIGRMRLPQGDGSIDVDPTTGLVRVRVQWLERGQMRSFAVQSRI
ncbi:MAG: type IV pilus modification protein PilV [Gammaproteobacteria bacterium]|nr:type IV pilus modification protein PilV [Gammaproteobacteria bacterium]